MSDNFRKESESDAPLIQISQMITDIVIVIIIGFFLNQYVGFPYQVTTRSMEKTLSADDMVLIDKASYEISSVKRFDIILFHDLSEETQGMLSQTMYENMDVKRVIGLPGEKVQIKEGKIYIDDVLLDTKGMYENIAVAGLAKEGVTVGANEFFCLGDWIDGSEDSRFPGVGNVKREQIIGKVWLRVQPMKDFGIVEYKEVNDGTAE